MKNLKYFTTQGEEGTQYQTVFCVKEARVQILYSLISPVKTSTAGPVI